MAWRIAPSRASAAIPRATSPGVAGAWVARQLIPVVVGLLAARVALGGGGEAAGQRGALLPLAMAPLGLLAGQGVPGAAGPGPASRRPR